MRKGEQSIQFFLKSSIEERKTRNSQAVQWLGLSTFTIMDPGSIPGWETKIPQVAWLGFKKKKERKKKEKQLENVCFVFEIEKFPD